MELEVFTRGPAGLGVKGIYISAFPSRRIFRRFVEDIAWGSSVWLAEEPYNLIHFITLSNTE